MKPSFTFRHGIWQSALDHIEHHNEAYKKGEVTYYLGENEFADLVSGFNDYECVIAKILWVR